MRRIHKAIVAFARFSVDDRGSTAIEYAIVGTFVSIVIVGTVSVIGQDLVANFYQRVVDSFPH